MLISIQLVTNSHLHGQWMGVSGKLVDCMGVVAWWLVYDGRSMGVVCMGVGCPSFVVRSAICGASMVHPTMLSAGAKSPEGTIADDIVGSPELPPTCKSSEGTIVYEIAGGPVFLPESSEGTISKGTIADGIV